MKTFQEFLEAVETVISYAMSKEHPAYIKGKKKMLKAGTALAKRGSSSAGGD